MLYADSVRAQESDCGGDLTAEELQMIGDMPLEDPDYAQEEMVLALAYWLEQRTTAPAAPDVCSTTGKPWNECDCGNCERGPITRVPAAESEPTRGAAGTKTFWLVESVDPSSGNPEGWWFTAPPEGEGGWRTNDATKAKQYTEAEARAVAQALGYFRSPFRWSKWIATEHAWMGEEPLAQPAAPQSERKVTREQIVSAIRRGARNAWHSASDNFREAITDEIMRLLEGE